MSEHYKVDCSGSADRDSLITILARNGYTVRIGREKRGKGNAYFYYVEYWR